MFGPIKKKWGTYSKVWSDANGPIKAHNFNKVFIPFLLNHFKDSSPNVEHGFYKTGIFPFNEDNCDMSKLISKNRNTYPYPTEGVNIDGKVERGTQMEHGPMTAVETNTTLMPTKKERLRLKYPTIYGFNFKLSSAPRAGTVDDSIIDIPKYDYHRLYL